MCSKQEQFEKISKPFIEALAMNNEYGNKETGLSNSTSFSKSGQQQRTTTSSSLLPLPLFAHALQYLGVELSQHKIILLATSFAPIDEYEEKRMNRESYDGERGVGNIGSTSLIHVDVEQFVEWLVSSLPNAPPSSSSQSNQQYGQTRQLEDENYEPMWWEMEEEIAWRLIELMREGGEGYIEELALKFLQLDRQGKGKLNMWGIGQVLDEMGLILGEEELHGLMRALRGGKGMMLCLCSCVCK